MRLIRGPERGWSAQNMIMEMPLRETFFPTKQSRAANGTASRRMLAMTVEQLAYQTDQARDVLTEPLDIAEHVRLNVQRGVLRQRGQVHPHHHARHHIDGV